ncbi:MAG: hypothetical protein WC860_08065 [Candidatus Margulisiibacteriota bacterium]
MVFDKFKKSHKEKEIPISRSDGSLFKLIIRQNSINPLDFSVILGYESSETHKTYRLKRYNGKSHRHKNKLEDNSFYGFHIHIASQRYQESKLEHEGFAEETTSYSNIKDALKCLVQDCNIRIKENPQLSLFDL